MDILEWYVTLLRIVSTKMQAHRQHWLLEDTLKSHGYGAIDLTNTLARATYDEFGKAGKHVEFKIIDSDATRTKIILNDRITFTIYGEKTTIVENT